MRSGVMPRAVPSIVIDAPSGTEVKTAVPAEATGVTSADAAGIAVHACQANHAPERPTHTPITMTGIRRCDTRGVRGVPLSFSDVNDVVQSSTGSSSTPIGLGSISKALSVFMILKGGIRTVYG